MAVRMKDSALAKELAIKFFEGLSDSIDLSQHVDIIVEQYCDEEGIDLDSGTVEDLKNAVEEVIEEALKGQALVIGYDVRRERELREANRRRVQAVLKQFPLHYDKLDIDIDDLVTALYGASGVADA